MSELGKLEPVALGTAWTNEASEFTPWLANDGLELLGNSLGLTLVDGDTEVSVGSFRADIVCKDISDPERPVNVVIENQLGTSDHDQLGKLLTYTVVKKAAAVVWIAKEFGDEHRAALDWLNANTGSEVGFFGLEIELWKIDDSRCAPKFNVVSKPNNWTRSAATVLTSKQQENLDYWSGVGDVLLNSEADVKPKAPQPSTFATYSIGRTNFQLRASFSRLKAQTQVALLISGDEAELFGGLLLEDRSSIEDQLGSPLDWVLPPEQKMGVVSLTRSDINPADHADWPNQFQSIANDLEKFHQVFSSRVKALPRVAEGD